MLSPWLVTYSDSTLYPHFDIVIKPDDDFCSLNGQRSDIRVHDDVVCTHLLKIFENNILQRDDLLGLGMWRDKTVLRTMG